MLSEELDIRTRECGEIGCVNVAVGTVDLDGEVEAFTKVDARTGGGDIQRDVGEGGKGEKEKAVGDRLKAAS